jgi:uroporphyrinogen III methyltransferase/synthase
VSDRPSEAAPLAGRSILVTRPAGQADALTRALTTLGATVIHIPLIRIEPPVDAAPLEQACEHLDGFDWIVVTSANAARALLAHIADDRGGPRDSTGITSAALRPRVCAVGPGTAACFEGTKLPVALVAGTHRAEGVVDALQGAGVGSGSRVLFVRGDQARDVVPRGLRRLGADVVEVIAYRTVAEPLDRPGQPDVRRMLKEGTIDAIVFTSGSAVRSFVASIGDAGAGTRMAGIAIACLGPVTTDAARAEGLEVSVVAPEATSEALAGALVQYFAGAPR